MQNTIKVIFSMCTFLCMILFSSCFDVKKSLYFGGIKDSTLQSSSNSMEAPIIQKNDILSISVSSLSKDADDVFNNPNQTGLRTSISTGTLPTEAFGYLVNSDGAVELPMIGVVHAAGLTKDSLRKVISEQLIEKKVLQEPVIAIRYLNFKVTVLGEVAKPSVITVPAEKISITEALGLAGDLTIYGKRDNILLVREENNKKITRRLNMNDNSILTSPYYYLKPNDVLYVEANHFKIVNANRNYQWAIPIVTGLLSLLIIFATRK